MNPGIRPAGTHDLAAQGAIKSWLDALASGACDVPAFLRAMQERLSADPDGTWEVLSQLDQYYRRGRIENEVFKQIKTALAESALGLSAPIYADGPVRAAPATRPEPMARAAPAAREAPASREVPATREPATRAVPVARDIVTSARAEQTDAHARREETESNESLGEPRPGGVLRRRYRIEAVVGQGGMGTVFQVLDEFRLESPGSQRVAVKVLHPAVAKRAELLNELRREFQYLQLLSHPNIIRVFDFDRDGPLVFFTMELLNGATLSRLLQARRLVPLERGHALTIIRDIGAALTHAHARGAVHGDLGLQNVFITGSGELRVMSFGSSRRARQAAQMPDPELTLPYSASTTASCQVLEGQSADARDDVFSLACLAYLLLSGSHPFAKSTAVEARDARLRIRRPAHLSGRQWHALRNALRWEREGRPSDVRAWLAEMDLGAAKRLGPLSDLLEPPAARESGSWLPFGVAAGAAALLFAAYWVVSHRARLPSIADTVRAPVSAPAAVPPASNDRARPTPSTAASTPPAPTAPSSKREASSATSPSGAAASRATAPPRVASPPVATTPPVTPAVAPTASPAASPAAVPAASAAGSPSAAPAASATRAAAPAAKAAAGASKLEMAADTVDVPAGQPSAQVSVQRKGNLRGETSFKWWTESGTAKPGSDFSAVVPQLAYVADGKSTVLLSIPVSNAPHARPKSFYVVIDQSEDGASLGTRTLTMVTLQPSD